MSDRIKSIHAFFFVTITFIAWIENVVAFSVLDSNVETAPSLLPPPLIGKSSNGVTRSNIFKIDNNKRDTIDIIWGKKKLKILLRKKEEKKRDGKRNVLLSEDENVNHLINSKNNNIPSSCCFSDNFSTIRKKLDYTYHTIYPLERQLIQDDIIKSTLVATATLPTATNNKRKELPPSRSSSPWVIFTGGVMGVGKTYTVQYLQEKGILSNKEFVLIDQDSIRTKLPEWKTLNEEKPEYAGIITQKESGMIVEIAIQTALSKYQCTNTAGSCQHNAEGLNNIIVDGTLQDYVWYQNYFQQLKNTYPDVKIAILYITAPEELIYERVANRAKKNKDGSNRVVPKDILQKSMEEVPKSMNILSKDCDFFVKLYNDGTKNNDIQILTDGITWESFQKTLNDNKNECAENR